MNPSPTAQASMDACQSTDAGPAASRRGAERTDPLDVERAVRERYSAAAQDMAPSLCCPIQYDPRLLDVLPDEILHKDYGCGDPSRHLGPEETVLDLGSGGGKICYLAAQLVGPLGQVIGVDRNDEMLALARRHQQSIGDQLGYHNTRFVKGSIQDLALDLDAFDAYLENNPIRKGNDWLRAEAYAQELRRTQPMIADDSIDVVVSNCVLNLVREEDRRQMFQEIFRVLRRGGRAVISDIVSDEPVPQHLQRDPELWTGCMSGAFVEDGLLAAFADVGFYGIEILERSEEPWATVEGIEFRSVTVRAYKGKQGACRDQRQAVIYRGPWKSVMDDDGHLLRRGVRTAVCGKTYEIYTRAPYAQDVLPVAPLQTVPADEAPEYDCRRNAVRDPRETKGTDYDETSLPGGDCSGGNGCC